MEKSAVGFKSTSGKGNLLKECVAEGTTKTAGDFGYNAVGFLLNGSETKEGETESKIVDCVVNSSDTTLTVSCAAYGIQLDSVLKPNPLDDYIEESRSSRQYAASWSPKLNFIAVGGNNDKFTIYSFDGSTVVGQFLRCGR